MASGYVSRYPKSARTESRKKYAALQNQNYLVLLKDYNIRYIVTSSVIRDTPCNGKLTLLRDTQEGTLYAIEKSMPVAEEIAQDISGPTNDYLGHIDDYDGDKIAGWALIPNMDSAHSQVFILLSDGKRTWKVPTCKKKRPDVSNYCKKDGLYDESGYTAYLRLYQFPDGTYKIGLMIENAGKKVVTSSKYKFISHK